MSTCPSRQGHHGSHDTCHEGHRKPPTAATCMYHGLRPLTWQPQALTALVKGPYHSGHKGSHRGPSMVATGTSRSSHGDLLQQPRGPPQRPQGPMQWPRGTYCSGHGGPPAAATGTSRSGHGGPTTAVANRGPHTVATGTTTVAMGDLPQQPRGRGRGGCSTSSGPL